MNGRPVTARGVRLPFKRLVSREQCLSIADYAAMALAAVLPWSTSGTAIVSVVYVIAALGALEWRGFRETLRSPAAFVPILLVALFAAGMLWATEIDWRARLHGVNPMVRLLVVPLLFYHFQRSARGLHVAYAFFASCTVLMAVSWSFWFFSFNSGAASIGVPVKNYIDQGQEFSLCIAGALWWIAQDLRARRFGRAAGLSVIVALFVLNMAFVVSSRTAFLTVPVLVGLFALVHLSMRQAIATLVALVVAAGALWASSPYLRTRIGAVPAEIDTYLQNCTRGSSMGERLDFWRRSLAFVSEAPLFGHGTGAIRHRFSASAVDALVPFPSQRGLTALNADIWSKFASFTAAQSIGNPHQQILAVGIQLGLVGIVLLLMLWAVHLRLFWPAHDAMSWLGFAVVAQNMFTSLANSHLIDFTPGWMYVIGVGVAGGAMLRARRAPSGSPDF